MQLFQSFHPQLQTLQRIHRSILFNRVCTQEKLDASASDWLSVIENRIGHRDCEDRVTRDVH